MACRIIIAKRGPNQGREVRSELFDNILKQVNSESIADLKYKEVFTKDFANWYGDWLGNTAQNRAVTDNYGEPILDTILDLDPAFLETPTDLQGWPVTSKAQARTSTEIPINKALNSQINSFLQSLGISVQAVNAVTDRNGKPLGVVASADMLRKVVQFAENQADGTTLPEEAAHFFVQLLKQNKSPLYNSMSNLIENYKIYDQVKNEYSDLYNVGQDTGATELLKDEAIGKKMLKKCLELQDGGQKY